jgi:hypothetical protein
MQFLNCIFRIAFHRRLASCVQTLIIAQHVVTYEKYNTSPRFLPLHSHLPFLLYSFPPSSILTYVGSFLSSLSLLSPLFPFSPLSPLPSSLSSPKGFLMEQDEFVAKLQSAYRQMVPLKVLLASCKQWQSELSSPWTCLECQEKIFYAVPSPTLPLPLPSLSPLPLLPPLPPFVLV